MQITCHGAASGEVTGSCYHIQSGATNILLDMGLFQGHKSDKKNRPPANVRLRKLDAVVLTHAHLDHTGRLPLLARANYERPIYGTPATCELTALILRDSAKIQQQDAERWNRKRLRAGQAPVEPLYTIEDAEKVIKLLTPVRYDEPLNVAPNLKAHFAEAGHMLGSTSVQIVVDEDGRRKTVVFSGDVGPKGAPMLRDFEPFTKADMVFCESTYGDRDHRPFRETMGEFINIVQDAHARRAKIIVPTFAIGRAQVLLLLMAWMFRNQKVPSMPVYLDSPMAIEASKIFRQHRELFDEEMLSFAAEGSIDQDLRDAHATASADESKAINFVPGPCMILAGAGMANAGRIVHHLRNNLWKPETTVIIAGYQGQGTLGRQLVDGAKHVKIFGEKIAVRAGIHTLNGFSGHAGQTDLLKWVSAVAPARPRIVLTHGEDRARVPFAEKIEQQFGIRPQLAKLGEIISL